MAIADSLKKLQLKFVFRKDAEIGGNKYTLQVLSLKDEQQVQSLPADGVDGMAYFSEMQKSILSRAIRAVDGEEIPDIIELEQDGKKSTKERAVYMREIIDTLPTFLIENLFQVYADIRDQKENEISSSLTYSWYKTPEQREKERDEEREKERRGSSSALKETPPEEATKDVTPEIPPEVPSPDSTITFKKLPTDYSDVGEDKKKA